MATKVAVRTLDDAGTARLRPSSGSTLERRMSSRSIRTDTAMYPIELSRSKLTGYPKVCDEKSPGVTPECFSRGSTMLTTTLSQVEWVGGPVPVSSGFPIEAFGNDGLWELLFK